MDNLFQFKTINQYGVDNLYNVLICQLDGGKGFEVFTQNTTPYGLNKNYHAGRIRKVGVVPSSEWHCDNCIAPITDGEIDKVYELIEGVYNYEKEDDAGNTISEEIVEIITK